MNRLIGLEDRKQLAFNMNVAAFEGAKAAEDNLGWGSNPFPPDSLEWRSWNDGFNRNLEWLAAQEQARRDRVAKRAEAAAHVHALQEQVGASWFHRFMEAFFRGRKA